MSADSEKTVAEPKQQVFISYSRKDIKFARRLADDLESAGFDVWWDISDLKGGDDWVRVIPTAIAASQFFVVLLSPDSILSEWVSKEYTYALVNRMKIVPAMIRPCNVPFALNTINYINFTTDDYETGFNNLLKALGSSPLPEQTATGWKKLYNKLPAVVTRNPIFSIGALIVILAIFIFGISRLLTPVTPPPPDDPTATHTATFTFTPRPTDTETVTPSPTLTFTPSITPTATITRTKTPIPVNFVLPTVCVQPAEFEVHSVNVRTGPSTNTGVILDAPAMEVGKCPLIGGRNEEDTWYMIAYGQTEEEFIPYEGGWIRKDLFDQSVPVFVPEVTLTPTPTITLTPSITPTFTITSSPTPTDTPTNTPTSTPTNTPTFTPTPTSTPTSTPTATYTNSPTPEPTDTP